MKTLASNILILLFIATAIPRAYAVQFTVESPCSSMPWHTETLENSSTLGKSVGEVTVSTLTRNAIPFVGTDQGINSIRDTVTGDDSLEVISDREMKAYGWCFNVNGLEPNAFAHEVQILDATDRITWFFGFAHYRDGTWISMCTPTNVTRPAFICSPRS